jgi:hypothetical protein
VRGDRRVDRAAEAGESLRVQTSGSAATLHGCPADAELRVAVAVAEVQRQHDHANTTSASALQGRTSVENRTPLTSFIDPSGLIQSSAMSAGMPAWGC